MLQQGESVKNGHICVTSFKDLPYLVEEQHKVNAESNGQSNELHGEEISRQKADNPLGISSKVDGGKWRGLCLGCLGLGQFLYGSHGSKLSCSQILLGVSAVKEALYVKFGYLCFRCVYFEYFFSHIMLGQCDQGTWHVSICKLLKIIMLVI